MKPRELDMETRDDLKVYDLDPDVTIASSRFIVAGPAGHDPSSIDLDNLPAGFRRVDDQEWEEILDAADSRYGRGCE